MSNKRLAFAAVIVILILLIGGVLYHQRSADKERKVEEEKQATERGRIAEKIEPEKPKTEAVPTPETIAEEEVIVSEEPKPEELKPEEPEEPKKPEEPVSVAAVPPPVSTADCKADPPKVARKRSSDSPEGMVYVPGGVFTMGSPKDSGRADETPAHGVCLTGFYIDKYEVTNAQFKKFVDATGYVTDAEQAASSENGRTWRHPQGPESDAENVPNHPVVCVSWNDANAYAKWAGKRLPTEAEWEKAARGTDARLYPWGKAGLTGEFANIADKSAALRWSDNSVDDNQKTTAAVGSFPAGKSVYGVEDMAGNVWEWCYDWWGQGFYAISPSQNPVGPETGEFRIIRGGSWFYTADGARTTHRMYFRPGGTSEAIGFRCVKDVG